jgi:hypothetical protein
MRMAKVCTKRINAWSSICTLEVQAFEVAFPLMEQFWKLFRLRMILILTKISNVKRWTRITKYQWQKYFFSLPATKWFHEKLRPNTKSANDSRVGYELVVKKQNCKTFVDFKRIVSKIKPQLEQLPRCRSLRAVVPLRTVHLHDVKGHLMGAILGTNVQINISLHFRTL